MSFSKVPYFPSLLATVSMLLLTSFVLFWNHSSYKRERTQLNQDIKTQLQFAYSEVKDSFIAEELVYFVHTQFAGDSLTNHFEDSLTLSITMDKSTENAINFPPRPHLAFKTISENIIGPESILVLDSPEKLRTSENKLEDTLKIVTIKKEYKHNLDTFHNNKKGASYRLKRDTTGATSWIQQDSIISYSNKLPFSEKEVTSFSKEPSLLFNRILGRSFNPDAETYNLLTTKLINNDLPSNYIILKEGEDNTKGMLVEWASNHYDLLPWRLSLQDYQPYLFKKLLPNILFSIFLLGMVGLAFLTLIRNWIKQENLVKTKNEFINNMTHELKTPLATLGVALEAIAGFELEKEKTREYVQISRHEVSRLSLLVDKVLNMAVFDNRQKPPPKEIIDIEEVSQEIIKSMKLQFENKNVTIDFQNLASNTNINGDRVHISNVLFNVIENALKYSSEEPKIEIKLQDDKENLSISIADNGIGISKENTTKIFDRFYRIPTNDHHEVKGHGLGLSYVKEVIANHNGSISVMSTEGVGSTFVILLPKFMDHV